MISQSTFNMLVTAYLIVVCTLVFVLSWLLNKPIDVNQLLIILAPLLPNVVHVLTTSSSKQPS